MQVPLIKREYRIDDEDRGSYFSFVSKYVIEVDNKYYEISIEDPDAQGQWPSEHRKETWKEVDLSEVTEGQKDYIEIFLDEEDICRVGEDNVNLEVIPEKILWELKDERFKRNDFESTDGRGFNENGVNSMTGTFYDLGGFRKNGSHINGTNYDDRGYDCHGYDQYGYDINGYDEDGYDRDGFDEDGYDRDGFDEDGYDPNGFNRDGIHKVTGTKYDENGYDVNWCDKDGYNPYGFNKDGIHKDTGTKYDKNGRDIQGYNIDGVNEEGFNREGLKIEEHNHTIAEIKDAIADVRKGELKRVIGDIKAEKSTSQDQTK